MFVNDEIEVDAVHLDAVMPNNLIAYLLIPDPLARPEDVLNSLDLDV